jgi:uncharacterized membrane protein YeaQ/YmgE (transglycosylase-associated protein family)
MVADFDITIGEILIYILAGIVIGFLARLLVPGRQQMSFVGTVVLGVVAAVIGGVIWNAVFPNNDGIAWIGSIIVAVVLVWLYAKLAPGRAGGTGPGGVRRPGRRRPA